MSYCFNESKENRPPGQSNATIVTLDFGRWIHNELPDQIVDVARSELNNKLSENRLRGAWVRGFAGDLHLHVTTYNADFIVGGEYVIHPIKAAVQAAVRAGVMALGEAVKMQLCSNEAKEILTLDSESVRLSEALELYYLNFPFTERGAEPIFTAKAINGGWGFFNRAVFNLFFNPDKGSGRRIEGNDYLGVVESITDLKSGKDTVRAYEFGPGNLNEMVALIADADEWRLSRVYAVRGKFSESKQCAEPAVVVEGAKNPVMIGRSQSGLPAVGEYTQAVGEFYFGPGGDAGKYRVGLMPVNFEEARTFSIPQGTGKVVAYAYQSYDYGRIPSEPDVVDIFSLNRPETTRLQRDAAELIRNMVNHGEFEPYVNPMAAETCALHESQRLEARFESIPQASDPLLEAANNEAIFTLSDIKADSGGKVGHTMPPHLFRFVAEASLQEGKDAGLIFATSEIIEVGDDGHLLMSHSRGADNNEVHLFAYRTFFRQVWVAEVLGYKWYGLGQDLVGETTAGHPTEELANLNDAFLKLLPDYLPKTERAEIGHLEKAYKEWKTGEGQGHKVIRVFSGNISGQGPGFAELPLVRPGRIGLLAIDKAGPSAFNLPIWWSLNQASATGSLAAYLRQTGGIGCVLEIWDVEHHRRIFLDVESEAESAKNLLGAVERFNIKRVWSRKSKYWTAERVSEELGEVLLAASTEKLAVITGGEYRGKDDPVLLAVEPLAEALNLFMRDCFYMTQGDGRGSHFMFPTPLPCRDAIATVNSRAVAVSAWVSVNSSGQICGLQDVFSDPIYETARDRAYRLNKAIWDAQGGNFIPVGVGSAKVEQSYPLAKTLARITASDSEFVSNKYYHEGQRKRA